MIKSQFDEYCVGEGGSEGATSERKLIFCLNMKKSVIAVFIGRL
jgi:hypothetical protein